MVPGGPSGLLSRPSIYVPAAIFVVLILLLSSSDLANLRLAHARITQDSSGLPSSANATGYLPFLLNASNFPLPSTLLNASGGAALPQLAYSTLGAVSVLELAYVQTSFEGTNSLSVDSGTYNTSLAVEAYTKSGCAGPCPRIPILWGSPVAVAKFGRVNVSADAIASSGALVAVAAAFGTKTTVWVSNNYGEAGTWVNLTSPHGLLIGGSPRLSLISCGLIATTISSGALYVSTFPFYCHYTANSPTGGYNGGGGTRGPSPPIPTVTGVNPDYGSLNTVVNITGTNYSSGAAAAFGGTPALSTIFFSSTSLQATAPPPGSGIVHVTVNSGGFTSNKTCADLFTYGSFSGAPTVSSVSPAQGPPGQLVTLTGAGFTNGGLSAVTFGGVPSSQIVSVTPTQVKAIVPSGNGTVYVTVTVGGKTSLTTCATEFTYNPGNPPPNSASLPPAISAYPAWILGGPQPVVGILAGNRTNSEVVFYNSTDNGVTFKSSNVQPFNNSLGSTVFSAIGGTRLIVAQGQSGQVAFASEGPQLFGLFTSRVQGRTAVETLSSTDSGRSWTGPYLTASYQGAVLDPEAATSPAGYAYTTWRENGAGPWQVDEAIFSFDGKALQLPATIAASGGSTGVSAGPPTLVVDGFQRPLYMWGAWNNSTGMSELHYTGGFLSPKLTTQFLRTAWNATKPADFNPMSSASLGVFKGGVNGTIVSLQTAIGSTNSHRLCWAWTNFSRYVYPNVTTGDPFPFISPPGSAVSGCSSIPVPGIDKSKVSTIEGPFAADTYLYVYSDWVSESLGYGTLPGANWQGSPLAGFVTISVNPPFGAHGSPYVLGLGNGTSDSQGDIAFVGSTTINPNALMLNASDKFVSRNASGIYKQPNGNGGWLGCGGWNMTDQVNLVSVQLTVVNASGHKFSGTFTNPFRIPTIVVKDLVPKENGSWWENVSLTFQEWRSSDNTCIQQKSSGVVPITPTWPSNSVLRLKGTFTTGLSFDPWTPSLPLIVQSFPDPHNGSLADNSVHWNNTIWANASAWNNGTYPSTYTNFSQNATYKTAEDLAFKPQPNSGVYYQVYAVIRSHLGGSTSAWPTVLDANEYLGTSPVQVVAASCSYYQTANPIHIGLPAPAVTNITDTSATVKWLSDQNGSGWLAYNDTWEAQFSQTATEMKSGNSTFPYAYQVELRGLRSWGVYQATLGVGAFAGCLEYLNSTHIAFQTLTQASLFGWDLPYDSITQEGGGAVVQWQEPAGFSAISHYVSGNLTYFPTSSRNTVTTVPLLNQWMIEDDGPLGTTMGVNLTGLTANLTYNITLNLNFTVRPPSGHGPWLPLWVGSKPFVYWYEKDTSGDGLTDWEKIRGWEVTYQDAWGNWQYSWATANPNLFATNGLTSDYQEKLYGLNPATVDSSASHMLDAWNLTFDLGPKTSPLQVPVGSNFRYWSEAGNLSSDYKWTTACQYYPGPGATCTKGAINTGTWSNISGADSWAWASRVFWSRSALTTFVNCSGVHNASWLRATLGNSSTRWTLTVWGKLSWGANPLAASTPRDGIADGARINPIYDEQIKIGSLWSNLTSCPAPSSGAYGWAVLFYLNWSRTTGPHELPAIGNYSTSALDDGTGQNHCGPSGISNYGVYIPVNGTSQNQSLQIRVILNQSSTPSTILKAQKFNGSNSAASEVSLIYDTFRGAPHTYSFSGTNATLKLTLSTVFSGVKDPTSIWLPTNNATLNTLPWGLKRYIGEQAFALLVVNQTTSSPITSYAVPYAQNASATYSVTLAPGLNNFIVPRGQFIDSVLGQAVLLGKSSPWLNGSARPPLLNAPENATLNYGSSNPLLNLACYWQNRAINNTTGGLTPICMHNSTNGLTSETGTPLGTQNGVVVVATTSGSGVDVGGIPGNPNAEPNGDSGAALQAIVTMNISAQTGLNLILASLLDNVTGGVNGTFLSVTSQVSTLGLSSVVTQELGNVTLSSSGLYGVPRGVLPPPPPPPPCNSLWCWGSNLVSGIITIETQFYSWAWQGVVAVAQFINDHLPTWLKQFGAAVAARTAAGLAAVGSALAAGLNALLTYLISLATSQLSAGVAPVKAPGAQTGSGVHTDLVQATTDVNNGNPNAAKTVEPDLNAQIVHTLLALILVAGITIVVVGILSAVSANVANIIAGIIIGLIVSLSFAEIVTQSHGAITLGVLVWWADNLRNCTSTFQLRFSCSPGSAAQQADQPIWDAAHIVLSDPTAVGLLWTLLTVVAGAAGGMWDIVVALGLALLGLMLTLYGADNPSIRTYTDIASCVVDFGSLYTDAKAIADPDTAKLPGGYIVAGITAGIDVGTLVTDAYS